MTHEQTWRAMHPRPEWDNPDHWLKSRPVYEEVKDGNKPDGPPTAEGTE